MKKTLNTKGFSIFAIVLLMASITVMTTQVQGQTTYTNMQNAASKPLPFGVTPDETYKTIAYMSFRPNPVGLGQPILVNLWLQPPIHAARYLTDYTVTITKPDGTQDVVKMNSYQGDATAWFEYIADQIGIWKLKFDFPGGYYPAGNYSVTAAYLFGSVVGFSKSVYYEPSSDGPYELVVQADQVGSWPASPLPTDYWTRPVSPENREWWPILGNYPATGIVGGGPDWPANTNRYMSNYWFIPYVQAPNSAHILWRRQDAISGLIGGSLGQNSLSASGAGPTIVYAGRAYQTVTKIVNGVSASVWQCYDLRTGDIFWEKTGMTQVPTMIAYTEMQRPTVPGTTADKTGLRAELLYIGSGYYVRYDPWLGSVSLNVSISPLTTGTVYADPYVLSVQTIGSGANTKYRLINWTIIGDYAFGGGFTNPRLGVLNNVTWPFSALGIVDFETGVAVSTASIVSPGAGGDPLGILQVPYAQRIMGANIYTGQLLWNITTDVTLGTEGFFSGSTSVADQGKFAVRLNDGHWRCWDLQTGKELWKSELTSWPWGTFGAYGVQSYGGNIISNQYDGVIAYDWSTGKIAWWYEYKVQYPYETPYGEFYPWFTGTARIADGKLYTYNTEHSPSNPVMRGWKLHCINVTSGEGIWNITGAMAPGAIADGYMTAGNSYDGYMYVFGRGKSATTVSGPQTAITQGQSVVLTGTVLDQSPAQPGAACVSKDSMATYMENLHMQKPIPANVTVTGVPVSIDAIDPNGNAVHIATVTSDMSGTFSYMWTPEIPGKYTVTATFMGDDSYGSSWAETAVGVVQAPAATAAPTATPPQQSSTDMYLAASTIAIIIAIAIVGLLLLRKRP
jgi:hypothetical protein